MTLSFTERHAPVAARLEEVSGIRPVTLLIAFGIVLIIVILMATGIAANHLRRQALATAEGELARIDSVLAAASGLSLRATEARLSDIAERVQGAADGNLRDAAAMPQTGALLRSKLGRFPALDGVALIATDGTVLNREGAWPAADIAWLDAAASAKTASDRAVALGAPVRDAQSGTVDIPLVYRLDGPQGQPAGAVVGLIPAADLAVLFAAAPLAPDAVIELLRSDGTVLARYPLPSAASDRSITGGEFGRLFDDVHATMVRHAKAPNGTWRIEALHALADYPAAVVIGRDADRVLAEWEHQGMWFGGFALAGTLAIGLMVYLIARQFRTHAALSAVRAENIEMERARLAAEAELLKAERLSVLGQLTATVAHELRNPLSAIRNTLFTVKELAAAGGVKLDRPVDRIERSIQRCDRIISDLLEYTRHRDLNRNSVHFDHWLAEVVSEQHFAAPITLTTELAAADAMISIDVDRMRRVIINLVENAAQALGELPPERDRRITVRTAVDGGEIILAIEDTGPGIAPENLERIFEPLFSTKSFGTGLGLPTVKQIVNQHDGIIAIDSEVGKGTRVTVRLSCEAAITQSARIAA